MRKVFEYYLELCHQAMIHQNELIFQFGYYSIIFSFELKNGSYEDYIDEEDFYEEYYYFNPVDNISDIDLLIKGVKQFISFSIKDFEYLGYREDLTEARTITAEMYSLVKKVNSFRRNSAIEYYLDIDYGDEMCGSEGNYQFIIKITEDLWWDKEFAKYLIELFNCKENLVSVPSFYTIYFRRNVPLKDDKSICLLSTNTKVRRLGYFKILSYFLEDFQKVPANLINNKFEKYCLQYKELLEDNEFKKGLINETKTGISAKPYIDTANDLEILTKINNLNFAGKSFKVFQVLHHEFSNSFNVFELSDFDKIYFLELILKNDYFYFSNLLELIFIEDKTNYSNLVEKYQNKLINYLIDCKRLDYFEDRKTLIKLEVILKRIRSWEKPEKYLEHLIMPRLNWMLDLGIISIESKTTYKLTEVGIKLFHHLCIWNDINVNKVISPESFLNRFMIHLYDDCYQNRDIRNPEHESLILEKMYIYIEDSFDLFKTLAPNRVTASQAASYARYKLYFNDKIYVGYQFILRKLAEKDQDKFIFKYQEQYRDGYIQKKK